MTRFSQLALSFTASAALIGGAAIASDGGRKLQAGLRGSVEVPRPGDGDGRGFATVTVNAGKRQVCYTLAVRNIATATMAHIHLGAAGVAGPVTVALRAPANGRSSGCVMVIRDIALAILRHPARYYVNVHNAEFPGGAVRGQLRR